MLSHIEFESSRKQSSLGVSTKPGTTQLYLPLHPLS